jgi:nucleoid DNA-binding protein
MVKKVKKTVKKATVSKKTTTKKASVALPPPVKHTFTKSSLIQWFAEGNEEISAKQIKELMADLENTILGSVRKGGSGEFTFPGLFKVVIKHIPAKPKRKGINPFTKEEMVFQAKPARVSVKIRPLTKLKRAAGQ